MGDEACIATVLVVGGVSILQDGHGLYNLNTLHKASGSRESKKPSNWLDLIGTKELIEELDQQGYFPTFDVVKGGNASGSYVHELLAVSYAGWVSPVFQLRVNQAFVDMKRGEKVPALPTFHDPAYQLLMQAVVDLDATRYRVAQLEAGQHATARELIETQQKTIEALQLSQGAQVKADIALEDAHHMRVEEFVLKNGLYRQYPMSSYRRMSDWLGDFCQQYGLPVRKVPVVGKSWDVENSYPLEAIMAFLRYDQKRPRQVTLLRDAQEQ